MERDPNVYYRIFRDTKDNVVELPGDRRKRLISALLKDGNGVSLEDGAKTTALEAAERGMHYFGVPCGVLAIPKHLVADCDVRPDRADDGDFREEHCTMMRPPKKSGRLRRILAGSRIVVQIPGVEVVSASDAPDQEQGAEA